MGYHEKTRAFFPTVSVFNASAHWGVDSIQRFVHFAMRLWKLEITEFEEKLKSMWGIAWGIKIRATNLETSTF